MEIKKTAAHIAVCGVIAAFSCLAAETQGGVFRLVITFIGDLAVLSMFSVLARTLSRIFTKNLTASCASDCVFLSLKIAFSSLCALSGGVMLHAAALIVDCVFARILFFWRSRESASTHSNL